LKVSHDRQIMILLLYSNRYCVVVLDVKGVSGLKHPNVKIKMGSGKFKADATEAKEDSLNVNSKDKLYAFAALR